MQHPKMAAPCRRIASRCLFHFLSSFSRTATGNAGIRQFSSTFICRSVSKTQCVTAGASSPWTLTAAVCLQRLPVISSDLSPIEQQFKNMLLQMELEKSVLSDHELRLLEDAERMSRKQSGDYDSDEEDDHGDQDIMMAQDLEDAWEQKLKSFQPAPRVRADVDKDLTSTDRCLDHSLVLLAEQQVGSEKLWLLPQTQWREGETLRETAERALANLPAGFQARFLGNAPCGVYKYKLPKAARTESHVGTKVFFFKAVLSAAAATAAPPKAEDAPLLWLRKDELEKYLKPAYLQKVDRFILRL